MDSTTNRSAFIAPDISLIIFDEAHQSIVNTFQLPVEIITTRNPNCKLLKLTATPGGLVMIYLKMKTFKFL